MITAFRRNFFRQKKRFSNNVFLEFSLTLLFNRTHCPVDTGRYTIRPEHPAKAVWKPRKEPE